MKGNPQNQDRKSYPKPILRERKTLQDSILTIPSSSDEQRPKKLLDPHSALLFIVIYISS
jgi:hypothetical protein